MLETAYFHAMREPGGVEWAQTIPIGAPTPATAVNQQMSAASSGDFPADISSLTTFWPYHLKEPVSTFASAFLLALLKSPPTKGIFDVMLVAAPMMAPVALDTIPFASLSGFDPPNITLSVVSVRILDPSRASFLRRKARAGSKLLKPKVRTLIRYV